MASTFEDPKKVRHKARVNRHPVVQRRVEEPERRRHWFLKRVKDAGDHKRWQTRSDQILRNDFLSQQKQWRDELIRSAPDVAAAHDYCGYEDSSSNDPEVEMVDAIETQENREIEALVALMDQEEGRYENQMSNYDEDYDRIFAEAVAAVESRKKGAIQDSRVLLDSDQDMDMS